MEPTNFPSPDPTPINEISPSLANELLSCQLRVGFARDPVHKVWRRSNTYSALGLAAHSLTEAAFKLNDWPDDPDALRELLSALWDEETEGQAAKLAKAWDPASPPPPLEWPGYALTRARTIRRAAKRLRAHTPKRSNSAVGTGVEIELRDTGSALFGRADRIEQDGPSTCVVDLKTGLHRKSPRHYSGDSYFCMQCSSTVPAANGRHRLLLRTLPATASANLSTPTRLRPR